MEVTVKKLHKPAIVYKIAPSGNSEVAGRKTVRVASVGDKNAFAGICRLSEYFPSSFFLVGKSHSFKVFTSDAAKECIKDDDVLKPFLF